MQETCTGFLSVCRVYSLAVLFSVWKMTLFACFLDLMVSHRPLCPLVLCEYSKFRIESPSYLIFDSIQNQSNCSKFSNTYLKVIYTRKGLCFSKISKKKWLSAALFLIMVLTFDSSWSLIYGPPSTGRIQQLAYNTNHKQGATKLLKILDKYLVMLTFGNGKKNCSIWFEISTKYSIWNEKTICIALISIPPCHDPPALSSNYWYPSSMLSIIQIF